MCIRDRNRGTSSSWGIPPLEMEVETTTSQEEEEKEIVIRKAHQRDFPSRHTWWRSLGYCTGGCGGLDRPLDHEPPVNLEAGFFKKMERELTAAYLELKL